MPSVLDQAYLDWLDSSVAEEDADLAQIREWYDGRQISDYGKMGKFLSAIFAEMFIKYPAVNIVKSAVKIVRERLAVESFVPTTTDANDYADFANEWWQTNRMNSLQGDLFKYVLRDKAAVVLVGWDGRKKAPKYTVSQLWDGISGNCRLYHNSDDEIVAVSKRWTITDIYGHDSGNYRLNVYRPESIERYINTTGSGVWRLMTVREINDQAITENPEKWLGLDGEPMGLAAIPFYNTDYMSECADLMTLQADVNDKVISGHAAGRLHGFPFLVVEGEMAMELDENGKRKPLDFGPGRIIKTGGPPITKIEASDLRVIYEGGLMQIIKLASIVKRWPPYSFDTSVIPSQDTQLQLEGPLVAQVIEKQAMLGDSFVDLMEVSRKLFERVNRGVIEGQIAPRWREAQSVSKMYNATVTLARANAAPMSGSQRLRELGFSEKEIIAQMEENLAAASAQATSLYGDVAAGFSDGSTPPDQAPPADGTLADAGTPPVDGAMLADQPGAPAADSNSPVDTKPADIAALQPLNRAPERIAPAQ